MNSYFKVKGENPEARMFYIFIKYIGCLEKLVKNLEVKVEAKVELEESLKDWSYVAPLLKYRPPKGPYSLDILLNNFPSGYNSGMKLPGALKMWPKKEEQAFLR